MTTTHSEALTSEVLIQHLASEFDFMLPGCSRHCDLINVGRQAWLDLPRKGSLANTGPVLINTLERVRAAMLQAICNAFTPLGDFHEQRHFRV